MSAVDAQVAAAVAAECFGRATARRSGRDPRWPWVAVIDHGTQATGVHAQYTETVRGKAFVDRDAAVACAERVIAARRAILAGKLLDARYRSLREQYGLPRELGEVTS